MVGGRIPNTLAKALVNPRSMRKQQTRVRLHDILREDSGDYSGEPSFQGGPLGFGGRQQLANPVTPPGLQDPAEKKYYPVVPSLYPVLFAQEEDPVSQLDEYTRARGDILYKDLPGGPRMNTLDNPKDHVPHGEDPENKLDSNLYGNVNHLLPTGRDDIDPGEQFMVDDLDDSSVDGLNLDKANIMASPSQWDVTSPEYRGKLLNPPSTVFDQLVKPVDWIGMETGKDDHPYLPGEINDQDFESRVMQTGNIVKPVIWVGNGDDRNNNNMDKPYLKPDYYIGEAMADNKTLNKNEDSKKQSPSTTKPKPTGNGLGTVQSRFDNFPAKGKGDKTEPFADKTVKTGAASETTSSNLSSVANDTANTSWNIANLSDDQVTILQEKIVKLVMEKLAKLS